MILGGGTWNLAATRDILAFAEANALATGVGFRCQDLFDNRHACYAGDIGVGINPKLAERVRNADLLIAVGTRLEETVTSGYTLLDVPRPKQRLIHIHPAAEELGRVYQADLPILSGMPQIAAALRGLEPIAGAGVARLDRGGARRLSRHPRAAQGAGRASTWGR